MKKLLLVLLLACGATAMANTTDPIQEKKSNAHAATARENAKTAKVTTQAVVKAPVREEHHHAANHITGDGRYGLGAYIVDFISKNNVKLMRRLLID